MVGGIGIAPGANINYQTGHAIFEATHGTAPDIVGKEKANPCSMLLSGIMMLDYMGWNDAGKLITSSLERLFAAGYGTADLTRFMENGKPQTTSQFSQKVIENL
jgi:isocitrate dehydrogenase